MKTLTGKEFCRKKPNGETKTKLMQEINLKAVDKKPLRFVVLFGGYKNPSMGLTKPGLGEIRTLKRLEVLLSRIKNHYSFRVELFVITTGRKGEIANGISSELISIYEEGIKKIVAINFANIEVVPIASLYETYLSNLAEEIREIRENEMEILAENISIPEEKIEISKRHNAERISRAKALENAIVYKILSQKEPVMLKKAFGNFIKLSFRNEIEEGAIPLFTCKKGMKKQPWNGSCENCEHISHCFNETRTGKIIYA